METRGIRNNNPGNIRKGDPWQGLMKPENMNVVQRAETEFCVFAAPKWGIRALARILIKYQDGHGLETVDKIIRRYAPPSENNTAAYADAVAKSLGVTRYAPVNVHEFEVMVGFVKAITHHENKGQMPYTDAQITAGLVLAGVEPLATGKVGQGRTVAAVKVGTAAVVVGKAAEAISAMDPAVPFLQMAGEWAPHIVALITLIVLGGILWARYDDHRKGLR